MTTTARTGLSPGSPALVAAIVAAQVLTQIGAFTLPALLPGTIERWHPSKTEAGWLVGSSSPPTCPPCRFCWP